VIVLPSYSSTPGVCGAPETRDGVNQRRRSVFIPKDATAEQVRTLVTKFDAGVDANVND
jgi:hypothetical protein